MESYLEMKFARVELLTKLNANRETHMTEYEEAMKGYFMEVQEEATELIGKLEEVKVLASKEEFAEDKKDYERNFFIKARKPFSNLPAYDRAIAMLEMSTDQDIPLDEESFSCYVLDEWDWKEEFATTNAYYSGKFGEVLRHRSRR